MNTEEVDRILGSGNEYFDGSVIRNHLRHAGYVIIPIEPTPEIINRSMGRKDDFHETPMSRMMADFYRNITKSENEAIHCPSSPAR